HRRWCEASRPARTPTAPAPPPPPAPRARTPPRRCRLPSGECTAPHLDRYEPRRSAGVAAAAEAEVVEAVAPVRLVDLEGVAGEVVRVAVDVPAASADSARATAGGPFPGVAAEV